MKTNLLTLLLLIVGIGTLSKCGNIDIDLLQEKTINGTWNLINVKGGGWKIVNKDYSLGDVKWIFNQIDSTLTVQNNIGNDNAFMLHSGSYTFNTEQNGETQIIFVANNDYRSVILFMDNNLIISDNSPHGFTAEFKR
jgi:hypothetical protein